MPHIQKKPKYKKKNPGLKDRAKKQLPQVPNEDSKKKKLLEAIKKILSR